MTRITSVGSILAPKLLIRYLAVAILWQLSLTIPAYAQTEVKIIDLGTLGGESVPGADSEAWAINKAGQVVGWSEAPLENAIVTRAFSWTPAGGMIDLGALDGVAGWSIATGVNGAGHVVGVSGHAFLWTPTTGMIDLGTLGGDGSVASAINDAGQAVGGSDTADGTNQAFLWEATTGMVALGTLGGNSGALAINSVGQVVGSSFTPDGSEHAFSWTNAGGMIDLGTLGGVLSVAFGVNDAGQVAGFSKTANGNDHAFLWSAAAGMIDLGTLGGTHSTAYAINNAGKVVGESWIADSDISRHAFSWTATGGMIDLGTLGGGRSSARTVNDAGQIAGVSERADLVSRHAVLWEVVSAVDSTPPVVSVPDPFTLEATGPDGAVASFLATATDPDDEAGPVTCTPPSGSLFALGTTTVTCTSTDTHGNTGSASFEVTVRDTTPPTVHRVTPSKQYLWPPNHRIVPITLTVDVADLVTPTPTCHITAVASNEPGANQWAITGPLSVNLVASRNGRGKGRVYTIVVTCEDGAGNVSAPAVTTVVVPHDHGKD